MKAIEVDVKSPKFPPKNVCDYVLLKLWRHYPGTTCLHCNKLIRVVCPCCSTVAQSRKKGVRSVGEGGKKGKWLENSVVYSCRGGTSQLDHSRSRIGSYQDRRKKFNLTHQNKRDYSKRAKLIPEATHWRISE